MTQHIGPTLQFSDALHAEKYRLPGETFRDSCARVANALKDSDDHFQAFKSILYDMRFLPAGRVQAAMGAPKAVTAYNCFVSGTIDDSFTDGSGSIMARATEAAQTMRMGGGIGYDFSTLRPRGHLIRKLQSKASGPVPFMNIFDAICKTVASSGHRRGAQMGVLRVDHPDIEEFINAKQNTTALTGFNVSIAVTDTFMEAVHSGETFDLVFEGRVYDTIDARALWERIMRATWDWAEPGVLFIDRINEMNPLQYCETIAATNPCGEQPLPPFGACLLGSFNLTRYVRFDEMLGEYWIDAVALASDVPHVVRAMDNVVDRTIYPLREQEIEAKRKRRMGLGVTGVANAIEAMGYPYGSPMFIATLEGILSVLRDACYSASVDLAIEKGAFPAFDAASYDSDTTFIGTLPADLRERIRVHGIRNSHLLSIAPTGTISFCADYVSSGIEPVFEYEGRRIVQTFDGPVEVDVSDYGYRVFGVKGKRSHEVTAQEHLEVLSTAQRFVDSACSKTINMDGTMPWEDFKAIYTEAWRKGCKGVTTFNKDGKRMGILLGKVEEDDAGTCIVNPETGEKECG